MINEFIAGTAGLAGSGNLLSIVSALVYMVIIGYILRFFSQEEVSFSDNFVLTFLLVSLVFLSLAGLVDWYTNSMSLLPAFSGTTYHSETLSMIVETLQIPGYSFLMATVVIFYRRMSRL